MFIKIFSFSFRIFTVSCLLPFQRLLVCNPALRLSADEAMAHPYFNDLNPAIKNDRCQ